MSGRGGSICRITGQHDRARTRGRLPPPDPQPSGSTGPSPASRGPTTPRLGWPPGRTRRGPSCTRGPGLCRRNLTGTAGHQGRHDGPDPTPEPPASRPRTPRHGASVGSNAGGAWPHARPHTRSGAWVCRTWRWLGSGWFNSQLNLPPRASRFVRSGFPQGHCSVPRGGGYGQGDSAFGSAQT